MDTEKNEDILNQGSTYQEEGFEDGDGLNDNIQAFKKKEKSEKPVREKWSKYILIGSGIVIVIVILIAVAITQKQQADKKAEEEYYNNLVNEEVEPFAYDLDEIEGLRLNGYTGDEIEQYEADEISAQQLIASATEKREKLYETEVKPYFDVASKEFKKLYKDTWVGQPKLKFSKDVEGYSYYSDTMNVDYEKLPMQGSQLFIKFYLKNGTACFMMLKPERYFELDNKGNIVLSIVYTQDAEGDCAITSIEEILP